MTERTGWLAGDGVRLFARWVGEAGPTIVVLHGGPGASHDYLRPQLDDLADGRILLYYDQRGGGASRVGREVRLGWRAHVADLHAIAAAGAAGGGGGTGGGGGGGASGGDSGAGAGSGRGAAEPLTLLGYSWGGLLALLFAAEHPASVARLALLSPAPAWPEARRAFEAGFAARQAAPAVREARAALAASGLRDRDPEAFWRRAFELAVAGYFRDASRAREVTPFRISARVREAVWQGLRDQDFRPRLTRIRCPTLIVHGAHDPTPLEAARELAGRLPEARLEVFEGSGHVPFVEERERLMRLLGDFLPRLGVAAAAGAG